MFDLRKIPVLRVLLPFFSGAVTAGLVFSSHLMAGVLVVSILLWGGTLLLFIREGRRPGRSPWLYLLLTFLLFFSNGVGTGLLKWPRPPSLPEDEQVLIRGEVSETPQLGQNSLVFDMVLHMLSSADSLCHLSTHLRVYFRMGEDSIVPRAGEFWQFQGQFHPIRNSGNPGTPDYRSILGRKGCWYRFYANDASSLPGLNRAVGSVEGHFSAALIRRRVSEQWRGGEEEISLLKAVCLGDRSALADPLRQAYAAAGGSHLLAVSGLHVGLIWWVLQYISGWMFRLMKGEGYRTLLVVGILWFYAFVTGLSSSVCRSVTMFSFFSLGRAMGARTHSLNGILVSAFLLVLILPARLMDVGFQLSYTAITGIIAFYPSIRALLPVKNKILRWLRDATSISLAAQLSTAPLVIYYFHQLPLYSLFTSLLAIPLLSVLIAVFVCSVPAFFLGVGTGMFNFLLTGLARLMNQLMAGVASLPGAVSDGWHLDRWEILAWMLLILILMLVLHERRGRSRYLLLCLIGLMLLRGSVEEWQRRHSSELVIAHFRGASLVTFREGLQVDHYCWYSDSTSLPYMEGYISGNWSPRKYQGSLHQVEGSEPVSGLVSTCLMLDDGIWLLGSDHVRGWVLGRKEGESYRDLIAADSLSPKLFPGGFVLLSNEPAEGSLLAKAELQEFDLVMDGSNRTWYRRQMHSAGKWIYDTDHSGAYMKRW